MSLFLLLLLLLLSGFGTRTRIEIETILVRIFKIYIICSTVDLYVKKRLLISQIFLKLYAIFLQKFEWKYNFQEREFPSLSWLYHILHDGYDYELCYGWWTWCIKNQSLVLGHFLFSNLCWICLEKRYVRTFWGPKISFCLKVLFSDILSIN